MNADQEQVLVVVVTYNAMPWAEKCFRSLRNSSVALNTMVIDNGSTDGTVAYIRSEFPEVELQPSAENLGFARANNLGFKKALNAGFKYVFLLNQDAWIEPDTIAVLLRTLRNDRNIGVACPVQLNGSGTELDRNFSTYMNGLTVDQVLEKAGDPTPEFVEFANAAAWLLPVSVLNQVGGFDPIFSHYGEDRDYCNRVRFHEFGVAICQGSLVYHDRSYSSDNQFRSTLNRTLTMGLAHLKNINHGLVRNCLTWVRWRLRKTVAAAVRFQPERLMAELKTMLYLVRMIPKIKESRGTSISQHQAFLQ